MPGIGVGDASGGQVAPTGRWVEIEAGGLGSADEGCVFCQGLLTPVLPSLRSGASLGARRVILPLLDMAQGKAAVQQQPAGQGRLFSPAPTSTPFSETVCAVLRTAVSLVGEHPGPGVNNCARRAQAAHRQREVVDDHQRPAAADQALQSRRAG